MRAARTVSEMVVESLARQAKALSEETKRPFEEAFEEAFAEVLKTPAGCRLGELADGPHRHEKAAEWQAGLIADREVRRPAHLRELASAESCYSWLERYMEWAEGADGRKEYHAFLRKRFAPWGVEPLGAL